MAMQFVKSERTKLKLRMALLGLSNSGKTLGAMMIAESLGGKWAIIDTEHERSKIYSKNKIDDSEFNNFEFDALYLHAPYSPDRYIEAIKAAENAGYTTLIIDSLSHAWMGSGGILDIHTQITEQTKGNNSFVAWNKTNPEQNKVIDHIMHSRLNIITTIRMKSDYELSKDDKGKSVVIEAGLKPIQRDGLDYEFNIVFNIDRESHIYHTKKDDTHLFNSPGIITRETGNLIKCWLESGSDDKKLISLENHLDCINKSSSKEELKDNFFKAATEFKLDTHFLDKIIEAKNDRKKMIISNDKNEILTNNKFIEKGEFHDVSI